MSNDSFSAETGLPEQLAAAVAQLGPPISVHRSSRKILRRQLVAGICFLIGSAVMNWWYWAVNADRQLFAMIALIGIPFIGLSLIVAGLRDRGLWVLVYPQGIVFRHLHETLSFPWVDVRTVQLFRVHRSDPFLGTVDRDHQPRTAWLPIRRDVVDFLGPSIALRRHDGSRCEIPSSIERFEELSRLIQGETFRVMWPTIRDGIGDEGRRSFGAMDAGCYGLYYGGMRLAWSDVDDVVIAGNRIHVRAKGVRRPWADPSFEELRNPHVLLALIALAIHRRWDAMPESMAEGEFGVDVSRSIQPLG